MKVNAYVMLGDPAFIEASLLSYYDLVEKIYLSFDEDGVGWSGTPIPVEECLKRARKIDHLSKMIEVPGRFANTGKTPRECETKQRRHAIDQASNEADWILQLDTDEVVGGTTTFVECLSLAESAGASALDYPSRWFFTSTKSGLAERCSRLWRSVASFPGAVAVKPGTELSLCRQTTEPTFRADFRRKNTDPWRSKSAHVDLKISPRAGIFHFSWVRTPEEMSAKRLSSWDAEDSYWNDHLACWNLARRHPLYLQASTPFRSRDYRYRLTPTRKTPLTRNSLTEPY